MKSALSWPKVNLISIEAEFSLFNLKSIKIMKIGLFCLFALVSVTISLSSPLLLPLRELRDQLVEKAETSIIPFCCRLLLSADSFKINNVRVLASLMVTTAGKWNNFEFGSGFNFSSAAELQREIDWRRNHSVIKVSGQVALEKKVATYV